MADETTQPAKQPDLPEGQQPILTWEAKEFAEYSRDRQWYLVVGIVGVALTLGALVLAVLSDSVRDGLSTGLVALVFALATYVVIRHADDAPRTITYSINRLGVQVGDEFRPYNELKQFWLIYKPPVKTLHLQTVNRFKPIVRIDLADLDPLAVRNTLRTYLPEDTKREEDFLDKFSRMIRL
jgi:hypothetical protein